MCILITYHADSDLFLHKERCNHEIEHHRTLKEVEGTILGTLKTIPKQKKLLYYKFESISKRYIPNAGEYSDSNILVMTGDGFVSNICSS